MLTAIRKKGLGHGARIAFAMLALILKVIVPPGFMLSQDAPASIVICSGHGSVTIPLEPDHQLPHIPKGASEPHCLFAGHGSAPLPVDLSAVTLDPPSAIVVTLISGATDLVAERSPTAALPPSHAPPRHLT